VEKKNQEKFFHEKNNLRKNIFDKKLTFRADSVLRNIGNFKKVPAFAVNRWPISNPE